MPIMIESFQEFAARQACRHVRREQESVRWGVVANYVFENGATSNGQHQHREPPDDEQERLKIIRLYVDEVLRREVIAFNSFKEDCHNKAQFFRMNPINCVPPPADAPELLRAGAERVKALRQRLADIDQQLIDPAVAERQRRERERLAEQQERVARIADEISNINI